MKQSSVSALMTLELIGSDGGTTSFEAVLSYDRNDPYAVTARFSLPDGALVWVFGRELLLEGLFDPIGQGDVRVWPCLDDDGCALTVLQLDAPEGSALLQVSTRHLTHFLRRTEALVPLGNESKRVDVDGFLAEVLATAG